MPELRAEFVAGEFAGARLGDQHVVAGRKLFAFVPEHFPGHALDAVSAYGALVHFLGHGNAEPRHGGIGPDVGMQSQLRAG
ncbi:hypothetical protein GCM10027266_17630 [Arenimonas alkanexedens]